MKSTFYPLALGLLTLMGCSKSKPEVVPTFEATGTYTVSTTPEPGPVRMFTKAGEVQNAALIRRFSNRSSGLFFSPGPVSPFQAAELTFGANSSATLAYSTFQAGSLVSTSAPLDITSQTTSQLVLTSKSASSSIYTPQNPDKCDNVLRDIRGVSPVYTCTALPPASGFSSLCTYKPLYVLNLHGTQASLATLSFLFAASANGQSCELGYRNDFNVFNPGLPTRLNVGDTLVVQEIAFPLIRK